MNTLARKWNTSLTLLLVAVFAAGCQAGAGSFGRTTETGVEPANTTDSQIRQADNAGDAKPPVEPAADQLGDSAQPELAGYPLALPRIVAKDQPLEFRLFERGDPLSAGPHEVREPSPEAPVVRPQVVLVPLLAFDKAGYRIGYGAGYYDRTLEALRAAGNLLAIGIAYAGQMVEDIPLADHDQPLDLIATDEGVRLPLRYSAGL